MTRRILVAGNLSLDDTVTPDGSHPDAPGGDAVYASLAVAAWGGRPTLLTLVGEDYPRAYIDKMSAAGIDTSSVRGTKGPTVHYRVTYATDGGRTFEWLGPEERLLLTSPEATDYATLEGADWLHVAAMPIEAQEVAVAAGRAAGVPISLDPHEEYVVGFEDRVRSLVRGVVFMPSELEARLLFPDIDIVDPVEFGFAAAERLDAWGAAIVAIKVGHLGSVVRTARRSVHVPALDTAVVDATGAGDAYCGGFVMGWVATRDAAVAAACGTVAAAETIGTFGAFVDGPLPSAGERLARVTEVLEAAAMSSPNGAFPTSAVETLRQHLVGEQAGTR